MRDLIKSPTKRSKRSKRSAVHFLSGSTLLVLAIVAAGTHAQDIKKEDKRDTTKSKADAVDYWPFKEGNTWTLETKSTSQDGEQTYLNIVTVTKVTTEKGKTRATLDYKVGDTVVQTEIYQADDKGVTRLASDMDASGKLSPPFPLLLYPLESGKKWSWKGTLSKEKQKAEGLAELTVSGPESIETKAGTFKAMHVHSEMTLDPRGRRLISPTDYWFAPGVGLVAERSKFLTNTVDIKLVRYKLADSDASAPEKKQETKRSEQPQPATKD